MDEANAPRVEVSCMTPQSNLLSEHDPEATWCLAEEGRQYLVFSVDGLPFSLALIEGSYTNNRWLNTKTGSIQTLSAFVLTAPTVARFDPPQADEGDWILILR